MSASNRFERAREVDAGSSVLGILRRRWATALTVLVVCVLVSLIHREGSAKSYAATASVAFRSGTLSDAALQVTPTGSSEPQREADTEVLIAHSAEVARAVREQLQSDESVQQLLDEVEVEAAANADVLNIVATTHDPQRSAQLANAFAGQYIAFRTNSELEGINTAVTKLRQQRDSLPAASPQRATIEQSLQRLSGLRAVAGGGANIIGRATVPATPTGASLPMTFLLSLVVGLALAFSVALLADYLDRRIKTLDECEREYRLSALAMIPQSAFRARDPEGREEALEAYRILRSALDSVSVTRKLDTLMVTSAISGEGKTTVAVALARVMALAGRRVVLMELDLRRPSFRQHFDLDPDGGLTNALTDGAPVGDLLEEPVAELPQLSVLPAGRLPHNPSELLSSPRITEIISELAARAEILIVDVPPLNSVADAQVLLNNAAIHSTLVVARVGHLKRDEARRARGILDRHLIEPVGLVVTGLSDQRSYGYGAYGRDGDPLGESIPQHTSEGSPKRRLRL